MVSASGRRVSPASSEGWTSCAPRPSYSGRGSHSGIASGPTHGSTPAPGGTPGRPTSTSTSDATPAAHRVSRSDMRHRRADAVVDAGGALLARGHRPGREVADVDDLHRVVRFARGQDLAARGEAAWPVAEPAGRVAGSDDQPGPHHHRGCRAVEHDALAGHLHRPVGLGLLLEVDVLLDRLDEREGGRGAARRRVVGVHVDRRDEDPVGVRVRRHGVPHPRRVPGDVDDRVEPAEIGQRSVRSTATSRAPSGTEPEVPRAAHVTSCPRATASAATALERKTVPPSTRSLMAPPHRPAAARTTSGRVFSAAADGRSGVVGLSSQSSKKERSTWVWSTSQSRYSSR